MKALPIVAALLALAACGRQASAPAADLDAWQAKLATADPARAKALFVHTRTLPGEGEAVSCAVCHGADGRGNYGTEDPKHVAPRLAGLNAQYVGEQLSAYAAGTRAFPLMQAMARPLSAQDVADLAVYVHGLHAPGPPPPAADAATLDRGRTIWAVGVPGTVSACASCHGAAGAGKVLRSPEIAGEPVQYLVAQLRQMHAHGRHGTAAADTMTEVTRRLSDADLVAVASYVAALTPATAPGGARAGPA